jgi:hypothetical protein
VLPGLQPARDAGNAPGLPVMFPVYENGMTIREEAGAVELLLHSGNRSSAPPRSGRGNGGFIANSSTSSVNGGSGWLRMNPRTSDSFQWSGSSSGRYINLWTDYGTD